LPVLGIALAGLFLRLYRLESWPPIHVDEAISANDALNLFARNLDLLQPSFTHYLPAALLPLHATFALFGPSLDALRLVAVLYGLGTVAATYWAGRAFFGHTSGLIAAAIVATSHVAIAMSRFGGINSQGIFLAALCLASFAQAAKSGGRWWAVWGIVTGLGAYSYEGFRIVPAVIAMALVLSPRLLWRERRGVMTAFVAFLIVASPVLFRFAQDPERFIEESTSLSVVGDPEGFKAVYQTDSVLYVVREQFELSLNYFVEGNNRDTQYMFRGPGFDSLTRALFIAGVIVAIVRFRDIGFRTALLWFWLGLLIGSAMTESPPLVPRLAMLAPPAALLAGGALGQGIDRLPVARPALIGAGVAACLTIVLFGVNYQNYFEKYQDSDIYWPWIEPQRAIGAYVASLPDDARAYLLRTPGVWSAHPTVDFIRQTGPGKDATLREIEGWDAPDFERSEALRNIEGPNLRIIAPAEAISGLQRLQRLCPSGLVYEQHGPMGLGGETALQFAVLNLLDARCLSLPANGNS
jgi:4-amino-4-deoxy-L-arabinose transferase-like glycosyltransferase